MCVVFSLLLFLFHSSHFFCLFSRSHFFFSFLSFPFSLFASLSMFHKLQTTLDASFACLVVLLWWWVLLWVLSWYFLINGTEMVVVVVCLLFAATIGVSPITNNWSSNVNPQLCAHRLWNFESSPFTKWAGFLLHTRLAIFSFKIYHHIFIALLCCVPLFSYLFLFLFFVVVFLFVTSSFLSFFVTHLHCVWLANELAYDSFFFKSNGRGAVFIHNSPKWICVIFIIHLNLSLWSQLLFACSCYLDGHVCVFLFNRFCPPSFSVVIQNFTSTWKDVNDVSGLCFINFAMHSSRVFLFVVCCNCGLLFSLSLWCVCMCVLFM